MRKLIISLIVILFVLSLCSLTEGFQTGCHIHPNMTNTQMVWPCQPRQDSNVYCGSSNDPFDNIDCSPFNYRPGTFNLLNNCGVNSVDSTSFYDSIISNSLTPESPYFKGDNKCDWSAKPGARVWGHFDKNKNSEYFVFHGCDTSGIQPDCFGDVKYIERFGSKIGNAKKVNCDSNLDVTAFEGYENGCPQTPSKVQGVANTGNNGDTRYYYSFIHPGTYTKFSNYAGGWWYNGNIDEKQFIAGADNPNTARPWKNFNYDMYQNKFNTYISKYNDYQIPDGNDWKVIYYNEKPSVFTFMLFPWTCSATDEFTPTTDYVNPSTNNLPWISRPDADYNKNPNPNSQIFSYPHIQEDTVEFDGKNFSGCQFKCYADNEPGSNGAPLYIEFYFGVLLYDNTSESYMIAYDQVNYSTVTNTIVGNPITDQYIYPICKNPSNPAEKHPAPW